MTVEDTLYDLRVGRGILSLDNRCPQGAQWMRERVGVGEKSSGTTYCRKKVRRMQQGGHAGRKRDSLRMCC